MELVERENEITNILRKIENMEFILVGGYAVSSLTTHRFSVDCDLVVSKSPKFLRAIKALLKQEGYTFLTKRKDFDAVYGGEFENYIKKINKLHVSVDLMINALVSRDTNASWSYEYIKKHSIKAGIGAVTCNVPEKELLVAMKIHAGRKADIRDVIMLREGCDPDKTLEHLKRGDIELLKAKLDAILKAFDDEKLIDSLKGAFRLKQSVEKDIGAAKKFMEKIMTGL